MNDDITAQEQLNQWGGVLNYCEHGGQTIDDLKAIIDHHETVGRVGGSTHTQAMELLQQLDELLREAIKEREVNAKIPV